MRGTDWGRKKLTRDKPLPLKRSGRNIIKLFRALRDRGVLSLSKTENPNDPDHPVTTIRANRENALVKEVYERPREGRPQGPARRRIQVQGVPLSQMILADRR